MVLIVTLSIILPALGFAAWLAWDVFKKETGTPEMRAAADSFQKEVAALLNRQVAALAAVSAGAAVLIYVALALFTAGGHVRAVQAAVSFLWGAFSAALAGFAAAQMSGLCAVKTAAAAKTSATKALTVALKGCAAGSIALFALCPAGLGALFFLMGGQAEAHSSPLKMAGFCLGAALAALFTQLAGGRYAVGGKAGAAAKDAQAVATAVEMAGRNDACRRLGADLFCSASVQSAAAMILGAALWPVFGAKGVLFPLAARAAGLAASIAGVAVAKPREGAKPMSILNKGYAVSSAVSIAGLGLTAGLLLSANIWLFTAGLIGLVAGSLPVFIAYYYNGYKYRPMKYLAASSKAGPAAVALAGISSSLESAAVQAAVTAAALLGSYYCGIRGLEAYTALGAVSAGTCGFYGTAVAAAGMAAAEAYMFMVGSLSPMAGNAAVLTGITPQGEEIRKTTGELRDLGEAVGPLAVAHAPGSAALAVVLTFAAYMESAKAFTGLPFDSVNIAKVEVFIGGLAGALLAVLFGALTARAALKAGAARALTDMASPGLLAAGAPVAAGLLFRQFGLGLEALAAFLLVCAVCGILAGAAADNCAAAWDRAGKAAESGNFGGLDGAGYRAILACSAAGNVLKDASFGRAFYALIKLAAAAALVLAPVFV